MNVQRDPRAANDASPPQLERKGAGTLYFPTTIQSGRYSSDTFIPILPSYMLWL